MNTWDSAAPSELTLKQREGIGIEVMVRLRRELALFLLLLALIFTGCSKKMGGTESGSSKKGAVSSNFYHPSPEDIIKDPETGLDLTKNILNITFSKKMDEAAIKAVISSVNGEIVGQDRAARLYQVRIKNAKSLEDLDKLGTKLLAEKGVEVVSNNFVSVHTNPFYVR